MTDVAEPEAVDEDDVVYIKHKLFTYRVPVLDADGEQVIVQDKRGHDRAKFSTRHASRFEAVIDMPEDERARGEALGAFFTDAEIKKMRSGGTAAGDVEAEDTGTAEAPEGLNFDDHDELVAWIKNERPTAAAVVAAAGDDPDNAEALIAAEEEATGGQPRKSVIEPLTKILQQ